MDSKQAKLFKERSFNIKRLCMNYIITDKFQKSLKILFPLLGIPKNSTFQPFNSYLWWEYVEENIETFYLIVYYKHNNSLIYKAFEDKYIFENEYISNCYNVEDGSIYIFDITVFYDTVEKFLNGRYSKFEEKAKTIIRRYWGDTNWGIDEIMKGRSYHIMFYPEKYYELAAEELGVNIEYLRRIGELCSKFDRNDETLMNIIPLSSECSDKILPYSSQELKFK